MNGLFAMNASVAGAGPFTSALAGGGGFADAGTPYTGGDGQQLTEEALQPEIEAICMLVVALEAAEQQSQGDPCNQPQQQNCCCAQQQQPPCEPQPQCQPQPACPPPQPAPPPPPPQPAPPPPQTNAGDGGGGDGGDDPLTFDLTGQGVGTSHNKINYDLNGSGQPQTINDIGAGDGALAIDASGDGNSGENGKGLLGNNTDLSRFGITPQNTDPSLFGPNGKPKDGFSALKAIADNAKQRGLIKNANQLNAQDLQVLQQNYGLKMKVGSLLNPAQSLASAGVTSINLSQGPENMYNNFDGQGNSVETQAGATFTRANGSQGGYSDLWMANQGAA
jgi:hypothetical protein